MDFLNLHTHTPSNHEKAIVSIELNEFNSHCIPSSFSIGAHPWKIESYTLKQIETELLKIGNHTNCRAIGEIGLDRVCSTPMTLQKEAFELQLTIAEQLKLPVVIHSVKTHSELLSFKRKSTVPWILHGFLGNQQQFDQLHRKDCYFSFGWRSLHHSKTIEVLRNAPLDRIFFETDEETIEIEKMYSRASEIRNQSIDILVKEVETNWQKLFKRKQFSAKEK